MNTQFEKFVAPLKEINELGLKNVEAVAEMQLKAAEENFKLGIDQVKNAAAVKDAEGWKNYLNTQAEVSQEYSDRMLANARNFVELGNEYTNEVQRIVKDAFNV